jgi:hypothetical protein
MSIYHILEINTHHTSVLHTLLHSLIQIPFPSVLRPSLLDPLMHGFLRCVGNAVVGEKDHDESAEILLPISQMSQRRFQSIRTATLLEMMS